MEPNKLSIISFFISYSHGKSRWLSDLDDKYNLIPFLEKSLKTWYENRIIFWYDKGIDPGENFEKRIVSEIDRSDFIILLISQDFLTSDFINKTELPRIQQKHLKNPGCVFPILLEPCEWEEIDFISTIQLLPEKAIPLIEYTQDEIKWTQVRLDILKSLRKKLEKNGFYPEKDIHRKRDSHILTDSDQIRKGQDTVIDVPFDFKRLLENRIKYALELNAHQRAKSKILKVRLNIKESKEENNTFYFFGSFTAENPLKFLFNFPFNYSGKIKGETYECKIYEIRELRFTSFWEKIKGISWVDVKQDFIDQANDRY